MGRLRPSLRAVGGTVYYIHSRHYGPGLGRFLQPDPLRAEMSPYVYVDNNPVSRTDCGGTFWMLDQDTTVTEEQYCFDTPWHMLQCAIVRSYADYARTWTNRYFTTLAYRNAMRHCLWSAMITRTFGAEKAKGFTDRHEVGSTSACDTRVDQYNNAWGRWVGSVTRSFESARELCYSLTLFHLLWIRNC
jgi:uncharacterized protein DUF6973